MDLATLLAEQLRPKAADVVIGAQDVCMTRRSARAAGAGTITLSARGLLRSKSRSRHEFLSLAHGGSV
jgi:GTP cyclohydrolase I